MTLHKCAAPGCPGRPYKASETPHPPDCGRLDFDKPLRHTYDPETSTEPEQPHLSDSRRRVLELVRQRPDGLTGDEVVQITRDPSLKRRLSDLVAGGLVRDSGKRRPSLRGRPCVVWTAAP